MAARWTSSSGPGSITTVTRPSPRSQVVVPGPVNGPGVGARPCVEAPPPPPPAGGGVGGGGGARLQRQRPAADVLGLVVELLQQLPAPERRLPGGLLEREHRRPQLVPEPAEQPAPPLRGD